MQYCFLSESRTDSKQVANALLVAEDLQEDEEAVAWTGSGGGEAADMMQEDEEANTGPSSGGEEVADMLQEDEEDAATSISHKDGDASAGPSRIDGAERIILTGTLFDRQKALLKMMLQRMFRTNTGARLELAHLVEQFNKIATKPASTDDVHQACSAKSSCHPNLEHSLYFQVDCIFATCTCLLPSHNISQALKARCLKMLGRLICTD